MQEKKSQSRILQYDKTFSSTYSSWLIPTFCLRDYLIVWELSFGGIFLYNLLCPRLILNSLYDLKPNELKELGIKGIIFDLDNTIIPWDSQHMSTEMMEWLHRLIAEGFQLCLVSNNMGNRVKTIAEIFGIPFVSRAYKPAKSGFRQAVVSMKLPPNQVAVVGDQLFTDILGGNRLGLFTIWVTPLSAKEFIGTKITRQLEKITVRILKAKGLMK